MCHHPDDDDNTRNADDVDVNDDILHSLIINFVIVQPKVRKEQKKNTNHLLHVLASITKCYKKS